MFVGWIILYKPKGISSNGIINKIKRFFPRKTKIGYAGTLDPLAEGILPVAIGEATKTIQFISDSYKEYIFEAVWGEQKNTDDLEGKTIFSSTDIPDIGEINNVVKHFVGHQQQLPPMFSAKKINGKRACDLLRKGEQVTLKSCPIHIKDLNIIEHSHNRTTFKVICSKGTYIRALVRDMGTRMGCYGYAASIIRSKINNISLKDSVSLEKLADLYKKCILSNVVVPIQAVLDDIPAVLVNPDQVNRLKSGQSLHNFGGLDCKAHTGQYCLCLDDKDMPVAIGYWEQYILRPSRVFNL